MARPSLGPFVTAREIVGVFGRSAPSPRELLADRSQRFERSHTSHQASADPVPGMAWVGPIWVQPVPTLG